MPVDAIVTLGEIDEALVEELSRLEPYGNGNPEPMFVARDVEVLDCRTVGQEGRHLKLFVRQEGDCRDAIGFGLGGEEVATGDRLDLCFTPEMNDYQGRRSVQLRLEAIRPHGRG